MTQALSDVHAVRVVLRFNSGCVSLGALVCAVLLHGCGSRTPLFDLAGGASSDSGGSSGSVSSSGSSSGNSSGSSSGYSGGREAGADAEASVATFGVGLISLVNLGQGQGGISAEFYPGVTQVPTACPGATYGPCVVWPSRAYSPAPGAVGAGTLTVTGTAWGSTAVTPGPGELYDTNGGALFGPGATLSVSGTGGTAPAFASTPVAGPPNVMLTVPATISTASDLQVSWMGGQSGAQVTVSFSMMSQGPVPLTLCTFDAAAGQGTVPQAALASLAGTSNGISNWSQTVTTSFVASGWTIQVQATTDAFMGVSFQ